MIILSNIVIILLSGIVFLLWELWGGHIIERETENGNIGIVCFCIIIIIFAIYLYFPMILTLGGIL